MSFHTIFHHVFIWGSILFWYLFIFIYCAMTPGTAGSLDSSDNIYYVIYYLVGTPSYWFSIILTPVVCLLPDILMQGMERWFRPLDHQIIQEWNAKQSKDSMDDKLIEKIKNRGRTKSQIEEPPSRRGQEQVPHRIRPIPAGNVILRPTGGGRCPEESVALCCARDPTTGTRDGCAEDQRGVRVRG